MTNSDDVLGFQHQILVSGALAFIGSVWTADDLATLFLVHFFYQALGSPNEENGSGHLDAALAYTQRKLLRLNKAKAEEILDDIEQAWSRNKGTDTDFDELFKMKGMDELRAVRGRLSADYSDPYYWAPFVFVGLGRRAGPVTLSSRA